MHGGTSQHVLIDRFRAGLVLLAFGCRDAAVDAERSAVGTWDTQAGGVASYLAGVCQQNARATSGSAEFWWTYFPGVACLMGCGLAWVRQLPRCLGSTRGERFLDVETHFARATGTLSGRESAYQMSPGF
jgi:hypothetical protein